MGVFGDNALACFNAGLIPLPIRTDKKKVPAVKGYHGYTANVPTRSNVIYWTSQFPDHNIAIRLPPFIVGIDIDAYDDKKGAQTLDQLQKELGILPQTIISTSREDGISGIRLFRLPPAYEGKRFIGTIPGNIDILHWGNRYAIVAPSIHPTGRPYRWVIPPETDGPRLPLAGPQSAADGSQWWPRWDSLPTLPEAWCERILAPERVSSEILAEYAPKFKQGDGTPAGLAVLRKEITVDWPESRDKNGWNNSLFVSAKRIAELIAGGELEFSAARKSLLEMVLSADPEMEGAEATIDSGIKAGFTNPRVLQDQMDFRSTDAGNARRFVSLHGENVRYCYPWKCWYAWDGRRWERVRDGEIMRKAQEVSDHLFKLAIKETNQEKRKELFKLAMGLETQKHRNAMVDFAKSDITLDTLPEKFDSHPFLFVTQNGLTYDCEKNKTYPVSRNDLITYLIGADYEPDAQCPEWEKFLKRVIPDAEMRSFVQRAIGYTLTGSIKEKALFVIWGPPDTGKSRFVEIILALLGDYGHTLKDDTITDLAATSGNNDDLANLTGKRFALLDELPEGSRLNLALIKKLTGSESYTAQRKYESSFSFAPQFKIWIDTNHRPRISGEDDAAWERVKLIPFTEIIPKAERDRDLGKKLRAELPGILNWALRGLEIWQQRGLGESEKITRATLEYRNDENDLHGFIEECCKVGPGEIVSATMLCVAYNKWSDSNISPRAFKPKMEALGFVHGRNASMAIWRGLSLLGTH